MMKLYNQNTLEQLSSLVKRRRRWNPFLLLLSAILLTGCADDLTLRTNDNENIPGRLTICIPNVDAAAQFGASRADEYRNTRAGEEAEEGTINDLWFFAFPAEGTPAANKVIEKLTENDILKVSDASDAYTAYTVDGFKEGKYSIYVLANLESYLTNGTLNKDMEETDVRELVLNFGSNNLVRDNLPMACLNTEVKASPTGNKPTDGVFDVGANKTVYVDLTFLCTKVRYTILFNQDSFSKKFQKADIDFKNVSISNISNATSILPVTETANHSSAQNNVEVPKFEYKDAEVSPFLSLTSNPTSVPANFTTPKTTSWANTDKQRAWQQVIYLPENKTATQNNKTTLTFDVEGSDLKNEYKYALVDNSGIERGHFYDIVAKVQEPAMEELELTVSVNDWSTQSLSYDLHGPYKLEVEKTNIDIPAGGKWSDPIWYRSDVAPNNIHFNFPKLGETDFYIAQVIPARYAEDKTLEDFVKGTKNGYCVNKEGDYLIRIRVNPAITYNQIQSISNIDPYKYFEVVAGALNKKIEVNPSLGGFLTVTPTEILVDVREYVSSGIDSGEVEIEISTNISNSVTLTSTSANIFTISTDNPFGISSGEGVTSITGSGTSRTVNITQGNGKLILNIEKLFEGIAYWQSEHEYTLTFSVGSGTNAMTETVKIKVKPYTTDYVIHFRCKDSSKNWNSPHIYVYQALSLPVDISKYAGRTVGYKEGNSWYTALEYAFTNDLAFRGWKGYGGPSNSTYDPNQGAYDSGTEGFVVFNYDNGWDYCPKSRHDNRGSRECVYDFDMNFNIYHTNRSACPTCEAGYLMYNYSENYGTPAEQADAQWKKDNTRMWPGIVMEKETGENAGWWKYTLSGVATPGKAMIMFANGHVAEGKGSGLRYPGDDKVGIPLFDFPDNEGWFEYDGSATEPGLFFSDDKPSSTGGGTPSTSYTYRFYWPTSTNATQLYFKSYNGDTENKFLDWGTDNDGSTNGYYYIEFTTTSLITRIEYKLSQGMSSDVSINNGFSDVSPDSNGIYHFYIERAGANSIKSGIPKNYIDLYLRGTWDGYQATDKYRFYETGTTGEYETDIITLNNGDKFHVATNNWDDGEWEPYSDVTWNFTNGYGLRNHKATCNNNNWHGDGYNFTISGTFTGKAKVKYTAKSSCELFLISQ
ncbi:MAG: hypothetical protein J1F16_00370 [Muribaculaceae bacterium]|nr:hypothetical protein [Muribaculaceae bacterium]